MLDHSVCVREARVLHTKVKSSKVGKIGTVGVKSCSCLYCGSASSSLDFVGFFLLRGAGIEDTVTILIRKGFV